MKNNENQQGATKTNEKTPQNQRKAMERLRKGGARATESQWKNNEKLTKIQQKATRTNENQ